MFTGRKSMNTMNKMFSAAVLGAVMIGTSTFAGTVTKTGSEGGEVAKAVTHTQGSTAVAVSKTGPQGATVSKEMTHTAGSGGTYSSTKTGVNGATSTVSASKTVTPAPTTNSAQ
jgi:hypothetical protein